MLFETILEDRFTSDRANDFIICIERLQREIFYCFRQSRIGNCPAGLGAINGSRDAPSGPDRLLNGNLRRKRAQTIVIDPTAHTYAGKAQPLRRSHVCICGLDGGLRRSNGGVALNRFTCAFAQLSGYRGWRSNQRRVLCLQVQRSRWTIHRILSDSSPRDRTRQKPYQSEYSKI